MKQMLDTQIQNVCRNSTRRLSIFSALSFALFASSSAIANDLYQQNTGVVLANASYVQNVTHTAKSNNSESTSQESHLEKTPKRKQPVPTQWETDIRLYMEC